MWCVGLLIMKCSMPIPAATEGATFCSTYRPIMWSRQDTRGTKEQVDKMNRVFKKVCRK